MPVALGAFMFVFRREYLRPLYTHPLGLMMLTAGGGADRLVGAFWMSRMVKIKV